LVKGGNVLFETANEKKFSKFKNGPNEEGFKKDDKFSSD
jgi:hypothetical protein